MREAEAIRESCRPTFKLRAALRSLGSFLSVGPDSPNAGFLGSNDSTLSQATAIARSFPLGQWRLSGFRSSSLRCAAARQLRALSGSGPAEVLAIAAWMPLDLTAAAQKE